MKIQQNHHFFNVSIFQCFNFTYLCTRKKKKAPFNAKLSTLNYKL